MPLERRHARIPAAIALVALAAFVVLWIGVRTPFARGMVAGWVEGAVGLPATVESVTSVMRFTSSQVVQPTSPTQSTSVPGRNVNRNGLRSP